MNKNRVELFSDGVFAIVLTLLVLNLKVPASHGLAALRDITPALIVHAATFLLVGVMWVGHHGGLARVDKITHRALLFNLLVLFWVTLLPFAAENAADRPLEPLGPSLLAFSCGAFLLSYLGFRLSVHSTIDDVPEMRRWKRMRVAILVTLVVGNFACSTLAWVSPWIGYGGALATVLVFLLLRSPPESEELFIREARAHDLPSSVSNET
jgi:TMEM175 potassium channel family protein